MSSNHERIGRARPPGAPNLPQRKTLPYDRPFWLRPDEEVFFITICCQERQRNQLCSAEVARAIFDSVASRNLNRIWDAHLVCLMPDHVHALISFPYEQPMKKIVADWKRFLATKLGIDWQRDFFDHRLRRDQSFVEKGEYIRQNPVRAGLAKSVDEWPYFWTVQPSSGAPGGRALPALLFLLALLFAACRPDMMNQPKAKPLSQSDFFADGSNARPLPPHTVAQGDAREDNAFYTGLTNGVYVTQMPVPLTPELLRRGRERFDAMCAECHDRTGSGNGMVVQRGFPQPPSYHVDRLRNAAIGHFFDVMTNGYGLMYSYATRVAPEDRWAIAAYIRALQLSHNASVSDVDPAERARLEQGK